jgi:signal transduction histidine kinase
MIRGSRTELTVDATIGLIVAAVCLTGAWSELSSAGTFHSDWPGAFAIAIVAGVPLLWRRRHPGLVALSTLVIASAYHFAGYPGFAPAFVLFASVYALAAYGRGWPALAGCVAVAAAMWFVPTLPPRAIDPSSLSIVAPALGLSWGIVLGASARQRRLAERERLDRAAADAAATLGQRIAEERLRIARDLHDVLAHTIAVISVQAGVALDALDDPPAARVALGRVRAAARQAIPQLRAAVEPLRSSTVDAGGGLAEIPSLLDHARAAGLAVHYSAPALTLAPEIELTVYRVVQEALTNVVRHASAHRVTVTIEADAHVLTVDVVDDGRGAPAGSAGRGLGLVGMAERVHALGGRLETGPAAGGGFAVHAGIPLGTP